MENTFFILNDVERPYKRLVTQKIGDNYYYIDKKLRKLYKDLNPKRPTPLELFGFEIKVKNGKAYFKKIGPSYATYDDGRPRPWQGELEFTLPIVEA